MHECILEEIFYFLQRFLSTSFAVAIYKCDYLLVIVDVNKFMIFVIVKIVET